MKNFLFYGIVGLIGISLVVGVIFILRARNAPVEIGTLTSTPSAQTVTPGGGGSTQKTKPLRPFQPADQTPKSPPWKEGDPLPEVSQEVTIPESSSEQP